jgi:hypothetical protein
LHEDRSWYLVGVELTCCLLHCSLVWAWALGSLTTRRSWAKIILVSSPTLNGPSTGFVARLAAFSAGRLGVYFGRRFGSPPGLPGGGITRIVPAPASVVQDQGPQHQVNTAHHNAPPDQSDRLDRTPGRLKDWLTRSGPRHSVGERRSQRSPGFEPGQPRRAWHFKLATELAETRKGWLERLLEAVQRK